MRPSSAVDIGETIELLRSAPETDLTDNVLPEGYRAGRVMVWLAPERERGERSTALRAVMEMTSELPGEVGYGGGSQLELTCYAGLRYGRRPANYTEDGEFVFLLGGLLTWIFPHAIYSYNEQTNLRYCSPGRGACQAVKDLADWQERPCLQETPIFVTLQR